MPQRERDARDDPKAGLAMGSAKAEACGRDPHSPTSHTSSQLINVPSESQLAVVTDASGSDSEVEEPLLAIARESVMTAGPPARADRVAVGMIWYAGSSVFFAGMGICSKLLGAQGYPVWEITFFRAIVIMAFALAMIVSQGDHPLGNRRGLLLLRGTLGYGSITCFFLACQMLPLADATTFTFLAPLIVALLSPLVLKERLGVATAVVIPLCIVGVLLIARPSFVFGGSAARLPPLGVAFGLLQPLFSATAKMTVRLLRTTEKTNVMVLYLMICTLAYSTLGCALTRSSLVVPTSAYDVALLVGQGLFGYGNQVCITKGLANARAASVMCMQYLSIVISQAAGMALFGEYTTWRGNLGMALVVLSMVVYMWWETARKSKA